MYWGRGTKSECAGYRILGMQKGEKEIQIGIGTSQEEKQKGMFKFKDEFNFRCLKKNNYI